MNLIFPTGEQPKKFTMNYGQVRNPLFIQAFNKLVVSSTKCAKLSYSIGRTAKSIMNEIPKLDREWKSLLSSFAAVDENGVMIPPDEGGHVNVQIDKMPEFEKAANEFNAREFECCGRVIKSDELTGIEGLTPDDMMSLEGLVVE